MRPIFLARLDKVRPALMLTREISRPRMSRVSVAPITSRVRGLSVEVPVGARNGLESDCVVNLDNIVTIAQTDLGRQIGWFYSDQERTLTEALHAAYDLADVE